MENYKSPEEVGYGFDEDDDEMCSVNMELHKDRYEFYNYMPDIVEKRMPPKRQDLEYFRMIGISAYDEIDILRATKGLCKKYGKRSIAPIFNNGADLLPRAKFTETYTDTDFESDKRSWWKRRVYEFPNSKIMLREPERERSNYYEVWYSDVIQEHIKEFFRDKYKSGEIKEIIDIELFDNEPYIEEDMRIFISRFILLRYRCIIMNENFDDVYDEVEHHLQNVYNKDDDDWFLR